jgi:polyferredoxin
VTTDELASPARRKKLGRRALTEHSQAWRRVVQFTFLLLNAWIGIQFYLFVRYFETGGASIHVRRPPGVEGWLPIASLMNLKVLLLTGRLPKIHPAGTLLLIGFLVASLIFRKSFCGWLCPVGTVSEYLGRLGHKLFNRNFRLPRWLDIPLRGIKYILMVFFVYVVASMSVTAIHEFLESSYGIVDDVKMLNLFRELSLTGAIILAILILGSLVVQNFWCRYFCPYGALMGLVSLASPLRIRRDGTCVSIALSVRRPVRQVCQWTGLSRFNPLNASGACSVSPPVRQKAHWYFHSRAAGASPRGRLPQESAACYSAPTAMAFGAATGIPICQTTSTSS